MMDWKAFVEPWWADQAERIEQCFDGKVLRPDFLLVEDGDSLWARFGILTRYSPDWPEKWDQLGTLADHSLFSDPEFGGMRSWTRLPWLTAGMPEDEVMPASPTMIQHGVGLLSQLAHAEVDLGALRSVVHWGGGSGLHSLLLRRLGATHTEYVLDLPIMSRVQRQFLSHTLGRDQVAQTKKFEEGKVNLVPIDRADEVPEGCDLFLALHSLSESTPAAQDFVVEREWFGATQIVMEWIEGIELFGGTSHWKGISDALIAEGRVLPREQARRADPPPLKCPANRG